MTFNPELHKRRSIRLQEYDYSNPGYYFVSICTYIRECMLGTIENNRMVLNDIGQMVSQHWQE
jgi:REP element-mobilizing transposase RayT